MYKVCALAFYPLANTVEAAATGDRDWPAVSHNVGSQRGVDSVIARIFAVFFDRSGTTNGRGGGQAPVINGGAPVGEITGPAKVLDGDTIVVNGHRIRLYGIDAPELDQVFWYRGERMASGPMAMAALEALISGVLVRCEPIEMDQYGRLVAKCFSSNGVDIGKRMVSAGWALAYRRYSTEYIAAESEARIARRGMWRGRFAKPWAWRAMKVE